MPETEAGPEPLCALYAREAVLPLARANLTAGRLALRDLLGALRTSPLTGDAPANRLALAKWLTDPANRKVMEPYTKKYRVGRIEGLHHYLFTQDSIKTVVTTWMRTIEQGYFD